MRVGRSKLRWIILKIKLRKYPKRGVYSHTKVNSRALAPYAQAQGKLAMTDPVSRHVPYLRGSSFDNINLIHAAALPDRRHQRYVGH